MSQNEKTLAMIEDAMAKLRKSTGQQDLQEIIADFQSLAVNGRVKLDHSRCWLAFGGMSATFLTIWGICWNLGKFSFWLAMISFVITISPLWLIWRRESRLRKLSDLLFDQDILNDYGLVPAKINGYELWESLEKEFLDFDRGDEDRRIEYLVDGSYEHEGIRFLYQHYKFHYVDVRRERSYNESTKRWETNEVRTTRYRYGILFDFPYARGIMATSSGEIAYDTRWTSSSIRFNKIFKVATQSEQVAARFFKPAVVMEFEKMSEGLNDMCLQISEGGRLCLSFNDDDLIVASREFGIKEPDQFMAEIGRRQRLPKLDKVLAFTHALFRYNDDNFTTGIQ